MHVFHFQNQQVSKKKKKKKAESLLGAPFHLKDGDTIGVKVLTEYISKRASFNCVESYCLNNFLQNLSIDNNRVFSTPDDEEDQRKLKNQAKQQKKG